MRNTHKIYFDFVHQTLFDLDIVYQLGHELYSESGDFFEFEYIQSQSHKERLMLFFSNLIEIVAAKELGHDKFLPSFVEITLYDPYDKSANYFYTLLAANDINSIEVYKKQMEANLYVKGKDRGVILPDETLYSTPYYLYKYGGDQRYASQLSINEDTVFAICKFKSPDSFFKTKRNKLSASIQSFLDSVIKNTSYSTPIGRHNLPVNTAFLFPILRPAAPLEKTQSNIFRGGGLFLFGHTDAAFNGEKLTLHLNVTISKSLLKSSHSAIDAEMLKNKQVNLELSLYHHFGSNLRNMPRLLEESVFDYSNLDDRQKRILVAVKNYFLNCIDNTRMLLGTYQRYFENTPSHFSLKEIVLSVQTYLKNLDTESASEKPSSSNVHFNFSEQIFIYSSLLQGDIACSFVHQFINNAVKEYEEMKTPYEQRKIIVSFELGSGSDNLLLDIILISFNTCMNNDILAKIGHKPVKSIDSTGLGFYFLNQSLEWSGAVKRENGLYFQARNLDNPNRFSLSFQYRLQSTF